MRVNVLSYEPQGGWILYDYAERLVAHLLPHVDQVRLTHAQQPDADVTFHVNYAGLRQLTVPGLHCTMVTHIDTADKFNLVRAQAQAGVVGMCMSDDTTRRMNTLTGQPRFFNFAPPAMMAAEHQRLTVMVSGRLYEDGRKNEAWTLEFFRAFRPADLVVRVMGAGWEGPLERLRQAGYTVEHAPDFDRQRHAEWLRSADHLLYTGFDEGALSTLDALLYGVVPIVTAQGYHLEQSGELLTFSTREQLLEIAARLQRQLDEANARRQCMTDWDGFAKRHVACWQGLLAQVASARLAAAHAAAQVAAQATASTPAAPAEPQPA